MGTCGFCLSGLCFLGDQFFSLPLTVFEGQIEDLCKRCFSGKIFYFQEEWIMFV